MTKYDIPNAKIPPGMVLVPDNDWAFMARVTALPADRKRKFYEAIEILFFDKTGENK